MKHPGDTPLSSTRDEPSLPSALPCLAAPVAAEMAASACQICLDDHSDAAIVRSLCGPHCSAVVCKGCLQTHVSTALADTIAGVLPRVRCPVCLERMPKAAWRKHVPMDVTTSYMALCATACSLLTPCCHDAQYTHMPKMSTAEASPLEEDTAPEIHAKLPALRSRLHAFVAYVATARQVVTAIDDALAGITDADGAVREDFVHELLTRIRDDERRAALLIAYHAVHRRVTTRCCARDACFNCKRRWDDDHEADPRGPCDKIGLTSEDMLQCRACRVALVKVDGCNAVTCPCGFAMDWGEELDWRSEHARQLIPESVDVLDVAGFAKWDEWRRKMKGLVVYDAPSVVGVWRARKVREGIATHRLVLLRVLQTYIWRRRFREAMPELQTELHAARTKRLARRLRRLPVFHAAAQRYVTSRVRWKLCLRAIERWGKYDEEPLGVGEAKLVDGLF